MKTNNIKKYLIRYTLEFFVIVLGISFSFFVQNIRKNIETDSKKELIIRNLLSEIESNEKYLADSKIAYSREMDYVLRLLTDSLSQNKIKDYPKSYSPLNPFLSTRKFTPSNSIYNSIVNDGSFNLIEPPSLKALIDDVYALTHYKLLNIIESEQKIADKADQFFVNHYPDTYIKNFWFNNDAKLIDQVFKIMKSDNRFKAMMVQKISFMEIKTSALDNHTKKRDSLIKYIKQKLN